MPNLQTIIIIILIIIGIILSIWFVLEITIRKVTIPLPFADGSTIAIRSLANNKFLTAVTTANDSYPACGILNSPSEGSDGAINIGAAAVNSDSVLTHFYVCQDKSTEDNIGDNGAQYSIHYRGAQNNGIAPYEPPISTNPLLGYIMVDGTVYPGNNPNNTGEPYIYPPSCGNLAGKNNAYNRDVHYYRFTFSLIAETVIGVGLPARSYLIHPSYRPGTSLTVLTPDQINLACGDSCTFDKCPAIVGYAPTNIFDPLALVNQAFEIVVVGAD